MQHTDIKSIKDVFAVVPSSVTVLSADDGNRIHAMLVATFTAGVSLEPALTTVAIRKESKTWPRIANCGTIGVSLLSGDQIELAELLSRNGNHASDSSLFDRTSGVPVISEALMSLKTQIHSSIDVGDHDMIVLELLQIFPLKPSTPLIFWKRSLTPLIER